MSLFLNFPIKYKPQEEGNYWNIADSVHEENHICLNWGIIVCLILLIIVIILIKKELGI